MIEKWQKLYQVMLVSIERCWLLPLTEEKQVEAAFKAAVNGWEAVKKELSCYSFKDKPEEIDFYKNVKPRFTCYMEYLPLVFLGISYRLAAEEAIRLFFWKEETKKLQKFIEKHKDFVNYYRSGGTGNDWQYFLPENYDLAEYTVSKIYDMDGEFMTSHDHLVSTLLGQEMYHEYAKRKLGW